jgi:hypothetical protein
MNGATLEADDLELFEQYLALAVGRLTERAFAAWLREHVQLARPGAAHEPSKTYRPKQRAVSRSGRRVRESRARRVASG